MDDAAWPTRFKIGIVVSLMLCGSKVWFTIAATYTALTSIEQSLGQAKPNVLEDSFAVADFGSYAFVAGVVVLVVTLVFAVRHQSRLEG